MKRPIRRIEPGDVSHESAARRLGLSVDEFHAKRAALETRGFPLPDPTTDLYDIDAIDAWRRQRNPKLFGLPAFVPAVDARSVAVEERVRAWGGG